MDKTGSIVVRKKKRQAQALLAGNRLQEARELYLQLCRIDRDDPENWAMAGVIMGRLGQMQEAASCLQRATALRPGFAEAHYNLGKAFRAMGQLAAAASSYETALRLQPDWTDALYNLGNVFDLLGRLRDAESCYRRVLAIIPDHVNAQKALGNVLMSLGDLDESLDCYQRLQQWPKVEEWARKLIAARNFTVRSENWRERFSWTFSFFATTRRPDVPLSRRCTIPGRSDPSRHC